MDYEGLINALQSQKNLETVTITFPEGYSVRQIAELLEENKVCSADDVLKACQSDDFEEYDIVAEIKMKTTFIINWKVTCSPIRTNSTRGKMSIPF